MTSLIFLSIICKMKNSIKYTVGTKETHFNTSRCSWDWIRTSFPLLLWESSPSTFAERRGTYNPCGWDCGVPVSSSHLWLQSIYIIHKKMNYRSWLFTIRKISRRKKSSASLRASTRRRIPTFQSLVSPRWKLSTMSRRLVTIRILFSSAMTWLTYWSVFENRPLSKVCKNKK